MDKKLKVFSIILAICVMLISSSLGVFALPSVELPIGGQITFEPPKYEGLEVYPSIGNDPYYYIEMGEYENTPIRWRYIGYLNEDGSMTRVATTMENGEAILPRIDYSKPGVFLQETMIDQVFNFSNSEGTTIGISDQYRVHEQGTPYEGYRLNDYSTSDIRALLNDTTENGYAKLLNIPDDDPYYTQIRGRSLESLYKGIGWNVNGGPALDMSVPEVAPEMENGDTFWLFSIEELYAIVGGGEIVDGQIPDYYTDYWTDEMVADICSKGSFMTRTPFITKNPDAVTPGVIPDSANYGDIVYAFIDDPEYGPYLATDYSCYPNTLNTLYGYNCSIRAGFVLDFV